MAFRRSFGSLVWASYGHGFSVNLKRLRTKRRISQAALADISGVSRNQISNLERNENSAHSMADPSLSTVYRLAMALEVAPAALLPGVGGLLPRVHEPYADFPDVDLIEDVAPFPASYVEAKRRGLVTGRGEL